MPQPSASSASLPIKGNRFLIVGGASLVGSASAEVFLAEGAAEVTILDSFFQGSAEYIKHLEGDKRLKLIQGDVMRLPQVIAATKGVDGVLHLAALMSITMDRDPWMGLDVNLRGTQNVIEACCLNGVKKMVFTSSSAVYGYGPGLKGDLIETTPFLSWGAPPGAIIYGATKIIGEQLCRDAFTKRGLDYVAVRYSTVYGERQHYRATNALYIIETHDRVRQGLRPRVVGDGSDTKHFVHVSDAARANAAAFAANATNVAVNISGPKPTTTLEIVRLVTELAGKDLEPEHVQPDPANQMGPLANARRIEAMAELVADARGKGAKVLSGGARLGNRGYYWPLTVLADVPGDARAMREEPFGPLALVNPVKTIDEAIRRANELPFGLAAYAFTNSARNVDKLMDGVEVGNLSINHFVASIAETPFGGVKDSGYGREGGSEGLSHYTVVKNVSHLAA